jgi:hypothetical protein
MISFAAAWWAAMRGGDHRDNAVPANSRSTDFCVFALCNPTGTTPMLPNVILWFAGVPIVVIILVNIFGFLN